MWRILGLLVFRALLNPVQGKIPAIRSTYTPEVVNNIVATATEHGGDLLSLFKDGIVLPDIKTGGLLGFLGTDISLNIENVQLIDHTLNLLPEINGAVIAGTVKVNIAGIGLLAASPLIKIALELTYLAKAEATNFSEGTYEPVVHECDIKFGDVDITLLGSSLLPSVINTIKKTISDSLSSQLCPLLTSLLDGVINNLILSVNVNFPFSLYVKIKFQLAALPRAYNDHAELDFSGDFEVLGKGLLSIPDDATPISPPPLQGYSHCHSIHPAFLNVLLSVVADRNAHSSAPESSTLSFDVSLPGSPDLDLANGQAVARLPVQIEGVAKSVNGSDTLVLVVEDILSISLLFCVSESKLHVSLSIASHNLTLVSLDAGGTQVASLEPHLDSLLGETLLPLLNEPFYEGIQLPTAIGTSLFNAHSWIAEGALVICV